VKVIVLRQQFGGGDVLNGAGAVVRCRRVGEHALLNRMVSWPAQV
jgi:hypothetical protein